MRKPAAVTLFVTMLLCVPATVEGQQQQPPPPGVPPPSQPPPLTDEIAAGDDEVPEPARKLVNWNEYDGESFSISVGAGFLYDYAAFAQDDASKDQIGLRPLAKLRDARVLLRGGFKTDRPLTWSTGIMYDAATNSVRFRQTQLVISVPEIWGYLYFGRTKEGFSLNKVMIGYAGWTMERYTMSDAAIPILADGVKWIGYLPNQRLLWNWGIYKDRLSEGESFSTYDYQTAGRLAWLPVMSEETVLHLALNLRYGKPNEGMLQLRSRPEAFPAPYFVDTGKFPAKSTKMVGFEGYYRPGPLLVGTEYILQEVNAPERGHPFFHGGEAFVSWLPTGEIRPYNTRGGIFEQISPARPVFQGGPGAWELVARASYIDLDSGPIRGGKFWRLTPMVNWHVSDNVRLEFAYGYGTLYRFGLTGATQFFQTRLQLTL